MADNIPITPGSGASVATDDCGAGGHAQIVKLAISTDGSATPIPADATFGLDVDVTRMAATAKVRVAANSAGLTTASTAYTANDQLGTIIELTSAVSTSGGFGTIVGALLLDKAAIVGPVSAYLFDRSVTLASDNAQADFSDSDMENCVGIIEFPPPTLAKTASPSNGLAQIEPLALPIKSNATSLWVALVTRAGHTFFGAVSDLRVTLIVEQ